MIAAQCPHATRVAGYRKWQELGRQVRTGERAIKILGYSTKKITSTDPVTGEESEDRVVRYPVLSVFDLSQTDGDPTPTDTYQLPTGDGPAGALDQLTASLTAEGWAITEKPLAGGCEGYTDHRHHVIVTNTGWSRPPAWPCCCTKRPMLSCTATWTRVRTRPTAACVKPRPNRPRACWPMCSA